MRADALEQLFVKRRAGRIELLLVLESPSGARERRTVATPMTEEDSAMTFLANYLGRDGATLHPKLRVRRERGETLEDAPRLKQALLAAWHAESAL